MKGMWVIILVLAVAAFMIQSYNWISGGQMAGAVGKVIVTWDKNKEKDLAGYKLYFGKNSYRYTEILDIGNNTEHLIENLETENQWYFAVTAYDTASNESNYSEEVSIFLSEKDTGIVRLDFNYYNFPNPFNPDLDHTLIRFYLNEPTMVSITIYDHTEQEVRQLVVNELMQSGEHLESWDGRYESGAMVANGVYYAVLMIGGERKVVQIAVVR